MIITVILRKLYVHCSARDPFLDLYARKIQQPNFPIMNELTKFLHIVRNRVLECQGFISRISKRTFKYFNR